ncbi:hypothetical protein Ahy_B03g065251 [Arachis hypogaea]|uniref:TF-B3 domain-containing protein n=1 Tax=Arachis hypogaea TaxID=3818 RepID=A0A445A152_ARAHY|nr:hypothetical protein Ahy_B03g065251 [Arachis hypogaea]
MLQTGKPPPLTRTSQDTKCYYFLYDQCVGQHLLVVSQALPISPDKLPSRNPYITLVILDGRGIGHRCFWKQQQNGSIALTRGWAEFYRTYQINLESILLFKHTGNSEFKVRIFDFGGRKNTYQPRPSKEPPYEAKGTYRRARCINNPSPHKAKAIAKTHKTRWPFFVMDLTDRVLHSHLLVRHQFIFLYVSSSISFSSVNDLLLCYNQLNVPHLSHFTGQRHTHSSYHTNTLRSRKPTQDLVASETVASRSSPKAGQTLLACANLSPEVWGSSRSCQLSQSQYCRSDVATMLQAPDSCYPYVIQTCILWVITF